MKYSPMINVALTLTLLLAAAVIVSEGRGGRRGGGTFGGLFGGWRKYKKPTSGGNSRRITNGSPMHTAVTKPLAGGGGLGIETVGGASASSMKTAMHGRVHASYPRQQMPGQYGAGIGGAHLPPGGSYYANTAAMPAGAIYHAQQPMRSSSGDLLFGMMAGHMMSHALFGHHRPHVTHVYHQNAPQNDTAASKVIIIDNGQKVSPPAAVAESESVPAAGDSAPWSGSAINPELEATPYQQPPPAADHTGGIICVPLLFNQTDPDDATRIVHVERIVCYPAPPLPLTPLEGTTCVTHTVLEADPADPTKTVEVQREDCQLLTTEAIPIAGEIGDERAT